MNGQGAQCYIECSACAVADKSRVENMTGQHDVHLKGYRSMRSKVVPCAKRKPSIREKEVCEKAQHKGAKSRDFDLSSCCQ